MSRKIKHVGVLTAGGDTPGLNAAIRGLGKSLHQSQRVHLVGFKDGFRGLMENRKIVLDEARLSGILTLGGTILGTSRDKPNKMPMGDQVLDMTETLVKVYHQLHLDCLICLGGGGTQKNAYHLQQQGLNVITLPKTIDNDVAGTDVTFGFNTALGIATDAIDRLHSTAHSHHRIILVEVMGHNVGWLTLGAGIAGGADVILIPEIPYDVEVIAEAIRSRSRAGKSFSIVAVAEGAMSKQFAEAMRKARSQKKKSTGKEREKAISTLQALNNSHMNHTLQLAQQLEQLTHLESRVTILGHVQRGGTPSAADRLLATCFGTTCADLVRAEHYGVMVSTDGRETRPVELEQVVGLRKAVPLDHPWIESARQVQTCLGDEQ